MSEKELAALCGLTEEQIKLYEKNDYQGASYLDVRFVMNALEIKMRETEFLVPLDTLRRTPITREELKSSKRRAKSQELSSKT